MYSTFSGAILGLSSATDTADELFHRYRNRLVHGPAVPYRWIDNSLTAAGPRLTIEVPRLGLAQGHLDWRNLQYATLPDSDFVLAGDLVDETWASVTSYIDKHWSATLLPLFAEPLVARESPRSHKPRSTA